MLLTVTPNPCIERTVLIESFTPGQVHRVAPEKLQVNAGGKGINAARVAAQLGCDVLATGWLGQRQRGWFEMQLGCEGIRHDFVWVGTDTRICLNILNGDGLKTEIVEAGSPLETDAGAQLLAKFEALLPYAALIAICGSYPSSTDGAFDTHLAALIQLAQRSGKRVIVDGKSRPFELALQSGNPPWCIKPNLDEAAQVLGRSIVGQAAELQAVREMLRFGVEVVLLSCGERGAYLGMAAGATPEIHFCPAPRVREVSPVGSGDALVGAFAAQFLATGDILEATRWGVAAGAANAAQLRSAFCARAEIEALLPQVALQVVSD